MYTIDAGAGDGPMDDASSGRAAACIRVVWLVFYAAVLWFGALWVGLGWTAQSWSQVLDGMGQPRPSGRIASSDERPRLTKSA